MNNLRQNVRGKIENTGIVLNRSTFHVTCSHRGGETTAGILRGKIATVKNYAICNAEDAGGFDGFGDFNMLAPARIVERARARDVAALRTKWEGREVSGKDTRYWNPGDLVILI